MEGSGSIYPLFSVTFSPSLCLFYHLSFLLFSPSSSCFLPYTVYLSLPLRLSFFFSSLSFAGPAFALEHLPISHYDSEIDVPWILFQLACVLRDDTTLADVSMSSSSTLRANTSSLLLDHTDAKRRKLQSELFDVKNLAGRIRCSGHGARLGLM